MAWYFIGHYRMAGVVLQEAQGLRLVGGILDADLRSSEWCSVVGTDEGRGGV